MAETRFPATRYALARFLLLLSWLTCPGEHAWAMERYHFLNESLKMRAKAAIKPGGVDG